jgi:four helix bundle protein
MSAINIKKTKVYLKGFDLSMEIFELSKKFPKEEIYSLTDQIRRSSRSVCVNLGEAWRKRQYPAHFVSKVSDADMENTETQIWLDYALACKYIDRSVHQRLINENEEIGKLLYHMINNPEKY